MVKWVGQWTAFLSVGLTQSTAYADLAFEPEPLIDRLDGPTRAKVLLALAGLVMLGLLMMGLTWLTFRMLRKQFRKTDDVIQRQSSSTRDDDWVEKPLAEQDTNQA